MIKVVREEKPRGQINLQNKGLTMKEIFLKKDLKAWEIEREGCYRREGKLSSDIQGNQGGSRKCWKVLYAFLFLESLLK